jgi:hypothetical protein
VAKIRYYTDEHVSRAVINGLRQRGVDVLSVPEADRIGTADNEQLAFALAEGRVLLTYDTDYLVLHAAGVSHAGIVYANQYTPVGEIVRGLMLIYQALDSAEMAGHVEYL